MAHDDWQKRYPWGEDGRVDPDEIGHEDEEEAAGPDAPSRGLITRGLSIVPFLLVAAVGLVVIDRVRHAWITGLGLTALDWWFMFGMVAFAMIVAGVRLRRAPGSVLRR